MLKFLFFIKCKKERGTFSNVSKCNRAKLAKIMPENNSELQNCSVLQTHDYKPPQHNECLSQPRQIPRGSRWATWYPAAAHRGCVIVGFTVQTGRHWRYAAVVLSFLDNVREITGCRSEKPHCWPGLCELGTCTDNFGGTGVSDRI